MKLLVLSDSHGYDDRLKKVLDNTEYDMIIHCGDSSFLKSNPLVNRMIIVKGNHDDEDFNYIEHLELYNKKIMVTHGHKMHVYKGYEEIYQYMKEHDIDICFHGHTHIPHVEIINNKYIINPGSIMFNRGSSVCGSYVVVEIDETTFTYQFYSVESLEPLDKQIFIDDLELIEQLKKFA